MPLEGFEPAGSEDPQTHTLERASTFHVPNRNVALLNSIKPKSDEYRTADGYKC